MPGGGTGGSSSCSACVQPGTPLGPPSQHGPPGSRKMCREVWLGGNRASARRGQPRGGGGPAPAMAGTPTTTPGCGSCPPQGVQKAKVHQSTHPAPNAEGSTRRAAPGQGGQRLQCRGAAQLGGSSPWGSPGSPAPTCPGQYRHNSCFLALEGLGVEGGGPSRVGGLVQLVGGQPLLYSSARRVGQECPPHTLRRALGPCAAAMGVRQPELHPMAGGDTM